MDLLTPFVQIISKYGLQKATVLLAVSGGVDSVVLCELSKQAGLNFSIAHCNFNLRGEESERDEAFVKSLGEKYSADVFVKGFDTQLDAEEHKLSIQEAARNLRYHWFSEVRKEKGFAYTLLAHHANDNIETVLMNFFRGTGLEGLTGMPTEKKEAHCLRPMLHIKRSEIEAFANGKQLVWVEDSSNNSNKYTRNFFRNEVLPLVKKQYPQAEENLLNNIKRFQQTASLYNELVTGLKKKIIEVKGDEHCIPVLKLMKYKHTSLLYEIIKDFGFGEKAVDQLVKLADAQSGKYIANESYRIIRHGKWFIIAPVSITTQTIVVEKENEIIFFGDQQLVLKPVRVEKFSLNTSNEIAQVDAAEVVFPLILRPWKAGDYFYPLGMKKKKKLARFFIDQKLSKPQKEKVWVLESHKKIVWVVGHRIDDRFKIMPSTKKVLLITLKFHIQAG